MCDEKSKMVFYFYVVFLSKKKKKMKQCRRRHPNDRVSKQETIFKIFYQKIFAVSWMEKFLPRTISFIDFLWQYVDFPFLSPQLLP